MKDRNDGVQVSLSATTVTTLGQSLLPQWEQQIGRVNIEWASLDYAMRIACKRLEGVGMESHRGRKIMQCANHGTILDCLKNAINMNKDVDDVARCGLKEIVEKIGKERNAGLYGRRNAVLHSFWRLSPEGKLVRHSVGANEWLKPVTVTEDEPGKLCDDIRTTWQLLLELTKPLLTAGQAESVPHTTQST